MRVCIVTTIFPPELGGPAIYSYNLYSRLKSLGNEVNVLTYGNKASGDNNIHIINTQVNNRLLKLILKAKNASKKLTETIKRDNTSIIYAQNPDLAGIPAYLASKRTNKPYIIKFVGDWAWETAYRKKWTSSNLTNFYKTKGNIQVRVLKYIQRKILNNAALIIVPSNHLIDTLRQAGVHTNVRIIENAVELANVKKIKLNGFSIIMVGRLVAHKHFDSIIRIMPRLDANLILIGDGPELDKLQSLSKSLNLDNKVKFLGSLEHEKTLSYISSSDVLLLPSIYEGSSHVILEAMLYSTPVIALANPGNASLIKDGMNGLLFDDSSQVLDKLLHIKNNRKLAKTIAYNAHKQVINNNTWEKHINRLLSCFDEVILNSIKK